MPLYERIRAILAQPGVSDIHVTVNDTVWVRTDGVLSPVVVEEGDDTPHPVYEPALRVLLDRLAPTLGDPHATLDAIEARGHEYAAEKSGHDFGADIGGVRLRCNLARANQGLLSLVMRRLNEHIPELASLGLPDTIASRVEQPVGLILVTGPTGSGKSTTLASMLDYLSGRLHGHILTIEDPVEYILPQRACKVTRKQLGRDAPTFLTALRAAMRQDPDIIMIGEIRDGETMRAAMSAAETGHLVLGTLHTSSAAKTIDRVLSFFSADDKDWARSAFASVLNCIVAQTLVPQKAGGRALAHEILVNTHDVRSTIAEGRLMQLANLMEQGRQAGQVLLHKTLAELVQKGLVDREAALKAAYDPARLLKEWGGA